jgi:hypothetical protein
MEKRTFAVVESPKKAGLRESCKKIKISLTPKKENDINKINSTKVELFEDPGFDINDLVFDDAEEEEFLQSVHQASYFS